MPSTEGSEAAIKIGERMARWYAIALTIMLGSLAILGPLNKYPHWAKHLLTVIAYVILVAAGVVWGCSRGWRMSLRMDRHGVTIRNYFRTYRAGWAEVSSFGDGAVNAGASGRKWALSVILRDGRSITACGTWRDARTRDETLKAIHQGARRYGIPANVMGVPNGRGGKLAAIGWVLFMAFAIWSGAHI